MSAALDSLPYTRQNSNNIQIIPYAPMAEDVYNIPDDAIAGVWQKCVEQKLNNIVFHDGSVKSEKDFIATMKRNGNLPAFAYDGNVLGFAWLNDIAKNRAVGHFCMFRETWGYQSLEIGKRFIEYWFSMKDKGRPIFDVIIGNTPPENKKAIGYIKRLGFEVVGHIPYVGVISYKERD